MQEIQKEDQVGLHFTVYFTACHLFIRTQCENMFYGLQLYIWHALGSMWTPSGSCYNWDSKILKTIQAIQQDSMPKNLTLKKCLKVLKCNNCVKWIKHCFEWILIKSGDTMIQKIFFFMKVMWYNYEFVSFHMKRMIWNTEHEFGFPAVLVIVCIVNKLVFWALLSESFSFKSPFLNESEWTERSWIIFWHVV